MNIEKEITIQAELKVSDEKSKTITFSGLAYSGGILNLGLKRIVNLDGLEIPKSIPLITNHDSDTKAKIGDCEAYVEDDKLYIKGKITADTFEAKNIIEQAKKGGKWQLSIGASSREHRLLVDGDEINGIYYDKAEEDVYVATKSILREVSVVAVGADENTYLNIEASLKIKKESIEEKKIMKKENEVIKETVDLEASLKVERERVADIIAMCEDNSKLADEAIKAGWSKEEVAVKLLESIRANRPSINIIEKADEVDNSKVIEASLLLRAGIKEDEVLKEVGEQAIEAGYKNRNISIKEAIKESIKASGGYSGLSFGSEEIRASFQTSLPGILSNVANKRLQQAFYAYEPVAFKLASVADLNNFKKSDIYSIADFGNLGEVATSGDKEAKLAKDKLVESKGSNQLKTYGKIVYLTRQQMIDDDLGAFFRAQDILGQRCAITIDQLFFKKLLANDEFSNGNDFFSEDNANLLDISSNALSVKAVQDAYTQYLKQTGVNGEPLGFEPKFLLVPSELKFLAKEICNSQYMVGGSSKSTALNPVAGTLEDVSSPYLSNATYTGYSATDWYLFGDPAINPALEIGFLNGNRTPTIEGADADFDLLAYAFRCYYDLGIGLVDYRGALKVGTVPVATS